MSSPASGLRADGPRSAVEVGQQEQELVAAEPRDHVGLARADAEAIRQLDQQLIAGVMPEGVVHELEVVEVQEQHADPQVEAPRARQRALEHLLEQRAVRQAGELVVVGEERDLLLGQLPLRDVEDHSLDQPGLAVLVLDRERLLHHPPDRSVLVDHPVLVVQREVCSIGVLVLLPDAVDVLLVDVAAPAVRIFEPLRGLDAEQVRHLRADVDAVLVLVDGIQVHDRGDLLHERPVLGLCLEARLATGLELRHVAEGDHQEPLDPFDDADVDLDGDGSAFAVLTERLDAGSGRLIPGIRREETVDGPVPELLPRESRQRLDMTVGEHDPAVGVRDHQAFGRRLQQGSRLHEAGQAETLGRSRPLGIHDV